MAPVPEPSRRRRKCRCNKDCREDGVKGESHIEYRFCVSEMLLDTLNLLICSMYLSERRLYGDVTLVLMKDRMGVGTERKVNADRTDSKENPGKSE